MLSQKIALGLKVTAGLFALVVVHTLGGVLGNLGVVSDIFLLLGAVSAYRLLTNSYLREEVAENFEDVLNLDDMAEYLLTGAANGVSLLGNEDLTESFFSLLEDEEDDTEVQLGDDTLQA